MKLFSISSETLFSETYFSRTALFFLPLLLLTTVLQTSAFSYSFDYFNFWHQFVSGGGVQISGRLVHE